MMRPPVLMLIAAAAMCWDAGAAAPTSKTRAAFSLLDPTAAALGLAPRVGRASKHPANPLWGQDRAWETRIDNGYAEVVYDPTDPNGRWRCWYTTFTECQDNARDASGRWVNCGGGGRWYGMLTANSSDGITWEKPTLDNDICYVPEQHTNTKEQHSSDHFNCSRKGALKTNIIMPGVIGTGILKDAHETNASRRFKVLGGGVAAAWNEDKGIGAGGVCTSPDGLSFDPRDCYAWKNIANMHWDSWWNMFFDSSSKELVATGRASNHSNPCGTNFYPGCALHNNFGPPPTDGEKETAMEQPLGQGLNCSASDCYFANRAISRVHTTGTNLSTMGLNPQGNQVIEQGTGPNDQLYVQATFPYLDVYLGVVMVYQAATYRQEVHCQLVWSNDTVNWHRIEPGVDLIELGADNSFESHICYGSRPVVDPDTGIIREYYFGGDGPHYGVRNSSLALAEFRPHGLAGVGGAKDWITPVTGRTVPILITAPHMLLTVDADIPNHEHLGQGYRTFVPTVSLFNAELKLDCTITGKNVTEAVVQGVGCELHAHVGKEVVFEITVQGGAMLYTVGFAA